MSYAARTTSTFLGQPFEGYWFSCGTSHWRYASGDVPRVILGQTYTPAAIARQEIDQCQELRAGQVKVTLPLDNPVAQLFLAYLPAEPVDLAVYGGQDGDAETVVVFLGRVASAEFSTVCELTVVPESDALKQQLPGLLYQIQCPRVLGGAGCGVDLATFPRFGLFAPALGLTSIIPDINPAKPAQADDYILLFSHRHIPFELSLRRFFLPGGGFGPRSAAGVQWPMSAKAARCAPCTC